MSPGENENEIARADCFWALNSVSTGTPLASATVTVTEERDPRVYETVPVSAKPSPFGDSTAGVTVSPCTSATGGGSDDPPITPRAGRTPAPPSIVHV